MKLITVHMPEPYLQALRRLVDEGHYPNVAEAIRIAVRDLLSVEAWSQKRASHGIVEVVEESPRKYVVKKK